MAERLSEFRSGLPCPLCGRSLLPVPADASFTFHCRSGHELTLPDLLAAQSLAIRIGLETLLLDWHREHRALIGTMEEARRNGHLDVTDIFHRRARSLELRIEALRSGFSRNPPARAV
jgi:hypothetical protein